MPCYHPLPAWKTTEGTTILGARQPKTARYPTKVACGSCIGCRTTYARNWAIRCILEYQQHDTATFATWTYNDQNLPPTLSKRHMQLHYKRLRRGSTLPTGERLPPTPPFRHFTSGEYGEINRRPHYHAILFGLHPTQLAHAQDVWAKGYVHLAHATLANIAYTAGYVAKKLQAPLPPKKYRYEINYTDPDTGEFFPIRYLSNTTDWQLPFHLASCKPYGIGGHARDNFTQQWRSHAIHNGHQVPVPRYFHDAWQRANDYNAETDDDAKRVKMLQHILLEEEQSNRRQDQRTPSQLQAGEINAYAKQREKNNNRRL